MDALKRAELYGTIDRSTHPDRLVCRSRINILEASTPPSIDCAQSPRVIIESTNAMSRALVDASKRAELYGIIDRSTHPDRLVCRSRISILEASTPNLLIVHDPLVSLLRAPMPCLEHWWMPQKELSFMALQTDRLVCMSF